MKSTRRRHVLISVNESKCVQRLSRSAILGEGGTSNKRDDGTILILAPLIMVITLFLSGIIVDLDAVYSAKSALQDRLQSVAASAANQIDTGELYQNGQVTIDQSRAYSLMTAQLRGAFQGLNIDNFQFGSTSNSVCVSAVATIALPAMASLVSSILTPTVQATAVAVTPSPISTISSKSICVA
ncbi:MAG: hypothetical protein M0019_01405 [Actinomycetota bacterium]|nr:hypothetical protein [Actinomycetota bacterium]